MELDIDVDFVMAANAFLVKLDPAAVELTLIGVESEKIGDSSSDKVVFRTRGGDVVAITVFRKFRESRKLP